MAGAIVGSGFETRIDVTWKEKHIKKKSVAQEAEKSASDVAVTHLNGRATVQRTENVLRRPKPDEK